MSMDEKGLKDSQIQTEEEKLEAKLRQMTDDVEIPDSLKPENMERLLEGKGNKKRFKWRSAYTVTAAAACCMIVIGIAAFGGGQGKENKVAQDRESASLNVGGIATAKDYNEIYKYIQAYEKRMNSQMGGREYAGPGVAESATQTGDVAAQSGSSQAGAAHSDTNIRQEGIEEGDIVKTDGKYLYILNNKSIKIANIENEEMESEGDISFKDNQNVIEIFIKDNRLIALYTTMEFDEKSQTSRVKESTTAETFDITTPSKPKSMGKIEQSGFFHTIRVSGEYVYLLSSFSTGMGVAREDSRAYIPQVQGKALDSSNILLPQYVNGNQYTVITTFSMKQPDKEVDSKAVFGSAGLVYVSENNIYVCEDNYNQGESAVTQTSIRKVGYKDGKLKAVGQTKIDGTLKDTFSIDEYEGNLRLVTTVGSTGDSGVMPIVGFEDAPTLDKEEKDSNSLYILDENLNKLGLIEGLAKDETVYSARFMGDTGYFVTFKQIDPLFSVDLSDPKNPKILGELKIPGFSDYLHPYGDNMLLGIGMEIDETGTVVEGVKLSMFDISDPSDVKEVDKYILKDCLSTNIAYDYKAALISKDRNLIGFAGFEKEQHFYIFSYDEKAGFKVLFDREMGGFEETRGLYAGDTLYIVSGNAVESYSLKTFEKIDDIVL